MFEQQIHGWLRSRVPRALAYEEGSQRMLFGQAMFECLYDSWRGDRTRHKSNSDGFEGFGWKSFGGESGPETMAVARYRHETCDSMITNEVVDFTALDVCSAVVAGASTCVESCVSRAWPGSGQTGGQILRVGAHVECGNRIAPDLPGCLRFLQTIEEPRFLFRSENGRWRLILAKVRNLGSAILNGCRGMTTVVSTSRIENIEHFLRNESGKVVACKGLRLRPVCGLLGPVAALICDDQLRVAPPAQ